MSQRESANQMKELEDKIQIFLTDQARANSRTNSAVNLSKEIMISITDFYPTPEKANGFRKIYGMTKKHTAGLDSGGFSWLMGKLKVIEPELLPCGIEVPATAKNTIDLYKRIGVLKKDYPIQLDLPPRYDQPPEVRKQLITRTVGYYYEMVGELPWTIPVIHGWSKEEMEFNLELITDPDKARVAMGTYAGSTRGVWTMGNLNPHKPKGLGLGSMKSLHTSVDYRLYTDNQANPDRDKFLATPSPGRMDLGLDRPFVDKVKSRIATPAPGKVDVGIQSPRSTPMVAAPSSKKLLGVGTFISNAVGADGGAAINPSNKVAVGSFVPSTARAPGEKLLGSSEIDKLAVGTFVASNTGPLGEKLAVGTYAATATKPIRELLTYAKPEKKKKAKRVSFKTILDRVAVALNFLKEDYEVFMLGGASPHMIHQIFMSGAYWTDTSAWRIKALMAEIYLWGHSSGHNSFNIGYSKKNKKIDDEGIELLKEYLRESTHPFNGMTVDRFLTIGKMRMKEWRKSWDGNRWEVKPFKLRAMHNAWILKEVIEPIAKEYATDPEGYHAYLQKCLEPRPILSKRLDYLYDKLRQPYVQTDLEVYLK